MLSRWYGDRKSVVEGKSVDLGGRRIIKKKKKKTKQDDVKEQRAAGSVHGAPCVDASACRRLAAHRVFLLSYLCLFLFFFFFFSSRRRYTILKGDWSSDVCSSD